MNDNRRWYNFFLGSVLKDVSKDQESEISLNGTVYKFLVDHSSIKIENILNIHKFLMAKNKTK